MPTNDGAGANKGATPASGNSTATAARATTAGTASAQAQQTGDQSDAPGHKQVADVAQRAPATSQPLGIPMAAPLRSAFDQLRDSDPEHPLVSATRPGDEPRGDQAIPAFMTPSGSLPITQNPDSHAAALTRISGSPTSTPQDVDAQRFSARHRLPEDFVATLGRAELMSIASDRGYNVAGAQGGRRSLRAKFLAEQAEDKSLTEPETETDELEDSDEVVSTADTAPTTTTGAGTGGTSTDQASGKPSSSSK